MARRQNPKDPNAKCSYKNKTKYKRKKKHKKQLTGE